MTYEMICSILLDRQPGIVRGEASDLDERFVNASRRVFPLMASSWRLTRCLAFCGDSPVYAEFERAMLDIMDMAKNSSTNSWSASKSMLTTRRTPCTRPTSPK